MDDYDICDDGVFFDSSIVEYVVPAEQQQPVQCSTRTSSECAHSDDMPRPGVVLSASPDEPVAPDLCIAPLRLPTKAEQKRIEIEKRKQEREANAERVRREKELRKNELTLAREISNSDRTQCEAYVNTCIDDAFLHTVDTNCDGQLQPCLDMEYTGAVHYQLVHQPGLSNCVFWQRRIISGGRLDDGAVVTRNETVVCLGGVHTCTLCAQETEPFIVHIVTQKHVSELMRTAVDNSATVHMAIVDYVRQLVAPYTFVQPQITLVVVGKQSRYKQEEIKNALVGVSIDLRAHNGFSYHLLRRASDVAQLLRITHRAVAKLPVKAEQRRNALYFLDGTVSKPVDINDSCTREQYVARHFAEMIKQLTNFTGSCALACPVNMCTDAHARAIVAVHACPHTLRRQLQQCDGGKDVAVVRYLRDIVVTRGDGRSLTEQRLGPKRAGRIYDMLVVHDGEQAIDGSVE